MKCKICENDFINYKALSSHIRQTHKITSENYYINYINSKNNCKICNKPTKFINLTHGFHTYCSSKCKGKDKELTEKIVQTFKSNPNNIEQARQNMIKYNKSDKAKQISREIGLKTGPINMKKAHKQDGIRYCEICKQDTKHIIGIGCMNCYNKSDSHKASIVNTIKNRYGEQYNNVYQVPSIKKKIVETSLKKYGTTNPGNSRDARIKANKSMRKSGNGSAMEDYMCDKLNELQIKYITQYKSDEYPYLCDFYLPDSKTYIEINIYWSHGKHFFNKNNQEDLKILKVWKEKANQGHKQYKNAVNVWTVKDLEKYDTAMKNKLNYVVLWSKLDIDNYIDGLRKSI